MPFYTIITVPKPEDFNNIVQEQQKSGKTICLYLTGSKDEKTKRSWCPDCIAHEPKLKQMLAGLPKEKQENIVLLECLVDKEPYKLSPKKDEYFYRAHDKIVLRSVPTFLIWEYDAQTGAAVSASKRLWQESDFRPEQIQAFKQNF